MVGRQAAQRDCAWRADRLGVPACGSTSPLPTQAMRRLPGDHPGMPKGQHGVGPRALTALPASAPLNTFDGGPPGQHPAPGSRAWPGSPIL